MSKEQLVTGSNCHEISQLTFASLETVGIEGNSIIRTSIIVF
jgi:hypothetical protein